MSIGVAISILLAGKRNYLDLTGEKTRIVKSENVRERTDENTVTKRFKSVNMSRKTKSVNLQFELDFVGLR